MTPSRSDLNFTPSSTGLGSLTDGVAGTVELDQAAAGRGRARLRFSCEGPAFVGGQRVAGQILDARIRRATFNSCSVRRRTGQRRGGCQRRSSRSRIVIIVAGMSALAGSQFKSSYCSLNCRRIHRFAEGCRDRRAQAHTCRAFAGRFGGHCWRRGIRPIGCGVSPRQCREKAIAYAFYGIHRETEGSRTSTAGVCRQC